MVRARVRTQQENTMRSMILATIAVFALASAADAATCRNHKTGAFRLCAPRVFKHPAVRHR
jgi:hypothetical protein